MMRTHGTLFLVHAQQASNMLKGSISADWQLSPNLKFLDLSHNRFRCAAGRSRGGEALRSRMQPASCSPEVQGGRLS